ncbi:MAG: tRNA (N6-isopentenyl adenosine(37)-C2)-methylthiotransferase MiaB [bacterium]
MARVKKKTFYIETYGCQMNEYDSELMAGILTRSGYQPSESLDRAEVILVNTCSVREHAERRVFGRLGELRRFKLKDPRLVLGLCGCMAQRLGQKIHQKTPWVDLVVGPDAYRHLPTLLAHLNAHPLTDLALSGEETYSNVIPTRIRGVKAWVAVMRGCDNFCSYCVVPYVRGRARSRPVDEIMAEISELASQNCKEVTLLGQNVNAYQDGNIGFAGLLRRIDRVDGLYRIRFTTSHPKDMGDEIIDAVAEGDRICEHLHLPLQSGSTRILRAMNRRYTADEYLGLISKIRKIIPAVSVTTDLIVGFPGESDDDFEATVEMVEAIGFDSAFTFKYSPRPGTEAADLADDVPEAVKSQRLERIIALQRAITHQKNRGLIGQVVEVLVEGESKKGNGQLTGRTRTNKTVVFDSQQAKVGSLISTKIVDARGWTLWGEVVGS